MILNDSIKKHKHTANLQIASFGKYHKQQAEYHYKQYHVLIKHHCERAQQVKQSAPVIIAHEQSQPSLQGRGTSPKQSAQLEPSLRGGRRTTKQSIQHTTSQLKQQYRTPIAIEESCGTTPSCSTTNLPEAIYHLQKALALYPFKIKYHTEYAIEMHKLGKTETAHTHEQLASGLKQARKTQIQLGISGNSVYTAALIQYYTGMFHGWNKGYSIASDVLNSYHTIPSNSYRTIASCGTNKSCGTISKIANSPHSNRPEVFSKSLQNHKPKSGNARIQWPGANAPIPKWGAAVIVFFMLNITALNVSANDKTQIPNDSIVWYPWQNKSNSLAVDNQIVMECKSLNYSNLQAPASSKKTPFGLDRIALILLILPLMALARAALPGKSKLLMYLILSSALALGITANINAQVASVFGTVYDTNNVGMIFAQVQYVMAEDETQTYNLDANEMAQYYYENIGLFTTNAEQPSLEELTTYIGAGQDHNINIKTKEKPSTATIYNMLGQPITTISPQWDGDVAHYYWDGSVANNINANMYLFVTSVNNNRISVKFMHTNSGQYVGNVYVTNNANAPPAYNAQNHTPYQANAPPTNSNQHYEYYLTPSLPTSHRYCEATYYNVIASERSERSNPYNGGTLPIQQIASSPMAPRNDVATTKSKEVIEKQFYVHLSPDPEGRQFLPTTDTIWLHEGNNYFLEHFVEPIPATIDQYFKLVDSNTREGLVNFTIRAKNETSEGEILAQALTNENGLALLENIPEDALLYLEYGPEYTNGADTSYYSSKGNKWQMLPDTWFANDTISPDTVKLALPNKNLIIPQTENDPAPATIWTPAEYVTEMIRGPPAPHNGIGEPVNIEQAYRNEIRIWLNENTETWVPDYLTQIDSLFFADGTFPYVVVGDSIDTEGIEGIPYHHETNYYPGELGFNVRSGGNNCYLKKKTAYDECSLNNNNTDYMNIILGGDIELSGNSNAVFKELVMRLNNFNDVTSRTSFANVMGAPPNEYDRAITRAIRINQFNRVSSTDERVQSFSLYYLTDSLND